MSKWTCTTEPHARSSRYPVLIVDIADGEASSAKTAYSSTHEDDRDLDSYLDDATDIHRRLTYAVAASSSTAALASADRLPSSSRICAATRA
jgi:hypothetical protein